jgi:hypothetical protein
VLSERKTIPETHVFVFDENGKKRKLMPADLGARKVESMGRRVKGLGLPPPTQMIVVPDRVLSEEEVMAVVQLEKDAFAWKAALVRVELTRAYDRFLDVAAFVLERGSVIAGRAFRRIRLEVVRRLRERRTWTRARMSVIEKPRKPSALPPPLPRAKRPYDSEARTEIAPPARAPSVA